MSERTGDWALFAFGLVCTVLAGGNVVWLTYSAVTVTPMVLAFMVPALGLLACAVYLTYVINRDLIRGSR